MKRLASILLFSLAILLSHGQTNDFDIVLKHGRVMDPETGLDAILNVGISGNKIGEISSEELTGREVIDVAGLVISPGFIDLHAHGQTNKENEFQAHDGVTTALELESGKSALTKWLASRQSKALINYGASACHRCARSTIMNKRISKVTGQGFDYQPLESDEIKGMLRLLRNELEAGALGIGLPVGYSPGATRTEIFNIYEFAAAVGTPIFTHVRDGKARAIQQAIANAVVNGTSLHIVHLNSMTLDEIDLALKMIAKAQDRGFDITTEVYPYTAASTGIESAMFDEGWQERLGISYSDIQLVSTGERLNEKTFIENRKKGGTIIIHMMKPEWIEAGIKSPFTMIGSDGMPYSPLAHPRSAGTFSRVLGLYVREKQSITLMEGLRKMTIMPAKRLESISPAMKFKGRLQVGSDADVTIFDPGTIIDKATFEEGLRFSEGIHYVLVNGTFIIRNGKTVPDVYPGKPIHGKLKE